MACTLASGIFATTSMGPGFVARRLLPTFIYAITTTVSPGPIIMARGRTPGIVATAPTGPAVVAFFFGPLILLGPVLVGPPIIPARLAFVATARPVSSTRPIFLVVARPPVVAARAVIVGFIPTAPSRPIVLASTIILGVGTTPPIVVVPVFRPVAAAFSRIVSPVVRPVAAAVITPVVTTIITLVPTSISLAIAAAAP